jgi:hypothetical protein
VLTNGDENADLINIYTMKYNNGYSLANPLLIKNDYEALIAENKEELEQLKIIEEKDNGVGQDNEANKESPTRLNVINTDLTRIFTGLFDFIKFENSKPYKMIDYILQNDLASFTPDKKKIEEIKKTVFNFKASKRETKTDHLKIPIFKSLYQQFKSDFNFSMLFKLVDKVNSFITESYLVTDRVNVSVKDKFTYQNYLFEMMKKERDFFTEMYDHEIIKALIYLCNKNFKSNNIKAVCKISNKNDNGFTSILMDKLSRMNEGTGEGFMKSSAEKIQGIIKGNEKFTIFLTKRFNKLFRKINFNEICKDDEERQQVFNKVFEYVYRYKEDDFEKIAKKINKLEKLSNYAGKDKEKNIARLWILFRFLYGFTNIDSSHYFTDELFWKSITEHFNVNSEILPIEEKKPEKRVAKGR